MLYDGMLRFLAQAKDAMGGKDRARAGDRLDRAFAILNELTGSLRPDVAPELCGQLESIYHFCMDHIVEANVEQDPAKLDEVMGVLTPLRAAWTEAVHTRAPAGGPAPPQALQIAGTP